MKKSFLAFFTALGAFSLIVSSCATSSLDPLVANDHTAIVSTDSGKVAGYVHLGMYNFKGIPYGTAERFMPAQKPQAWEGIRSSRAYGPACPTDVNATVLNDEFELAQQHNFAYMTEDCLRANVWTPGINDGKKRPVMVWLHGGGYTSGSSSELPFYDGENLSKKGDVVVVSINHRLNVLGFLDLRAFGGKYANSSNLGMKDIVLALEWVKTNIAAFGGDPENVTIFGQSGGGGKVLTLMSSPAAKGLFDKAIIESGAVGAYTDPAISQELGASLVKTLGLTASTIDEIQNVPFDTLWDAGKKALAEVSANHDMMGPFGPSLSWQPNLEAGFLPYQSSSPEAIALSKDVPLIIGTNKSEFSMAYTNPAFVTADEATIQSVLSRQWGDKTEAYIAAVKKAYPDFTKPVDLLDLDAMFRPGAVRTARARAATEGCAPVYNYVFTWASPVLDGYYSSVHCLEIPFIFDNIDLAIGHTGGGQEAKALAAKLSQYWINFAHTGNPNGSGLPQWPSFKADEDITQILNSTIVTKSNLDRDILSFYGM